MRIFLRKTISFLAVCSISAILFAGGSSQKKAEPQKQKTLVEQGLSLI